MKHLAQHAEATTSHLAPRDLIDYSEASAQCHVQFQQNSLGVLAQSATVANETGTEAVSYVYWCKTRHRMTDSEQ